MSSLFSQVRNGIIFSVTCLTCFGIAYASISWPATPGGETAGGKYSAKLVPSGAIMAFNLASCPSGWSDYTPAYGRFLRGIDKSGTSIDSDGLRVAGAIQGDEFKGHTHATVNSNNLTYRVGISGWPVPAWFSDGTGSPTTTSAGWTETRPKNVAVLYCVKD